MSCGTGAPTFRLLDALVGWSAIKSSNLEGLEENEREEMEGVRLRQQHTGAVSAADLLAYLAPPRLARGCGHCELYLINKANLWRSDCCLPDWQPVWSQACDPKRLVKARAIAVRSHRIAVSDAGAQRVWIWDRNGGHLAADIHVGSPGPLAFTPWGELLIADGWTILRCGLAGERFGQLQIALPPLPINSKTTIERLAVSDDCAIWLVTRSVEKTEAVLRLWRAARCDCALRQDSHCNCVPSGLKHCDREFKPATLEDLRKSFKPTGITAASDIGFCLQECGQDGLPTERCFDWDGNKLDHDRVITEDAPRLATVGKLVTGAIDSGIPRCVWHRVRIDADIPSGANVEIKVATSEIPYDHPLRDIHSLDWQVATVGARDFLINQPAGRYLFLQMTLRGDGKATPIVRRMRLDFPRATSLDALPPVYRETPEAEDFSERFLSLFDATIADLDRAIERAPALLDAGSVPEEVLPWLGGFLDLAFDPAWSPDQRRRILQALPKLYEIRGTPAGLIEAIKLVFDVDAVIQELSDERLWGAVGKRGEKNVAPEARLGGVRLFSKARARFRLGSSALDAAPLRSFGDPDHDPLLAQAYRIRVLVPRVYGPEARARVVRLVNSQKPAHTVASVQMAGDGFIVGYSSTLDLNPLAPLPPPVLGQAGNIRLSRASVLWHGGAGRRRGIQLGDNAVVGVHTIVE
jgi:phage tail-like protein